MKALTLWPEWAWAVHTLDKRVENRSWMIPRGEWFGLHAGKHVGGRNASEAACDADVRVRFMARAAGWEVSYREGDLRTSRATFTKEGRQPVVWNVYETPTSCLLGRFRVTGYDRSGAGWAVPGQIGNVLEYQPFRRPVPCKGAQGLWVVPAEVVEEIEEVGND